jgi:hypothetical protein
MATNRVNGSAQMRSKPQDKKYQLHHSASEADIGLRRDTAATGHQSEVVDRRAM